MCAQGCFGSAFVCGALLVSHHLSDIVVKFVHLAEVCHGAGVRISYKRACSLVWDGKWRNKVCVGEIKRGFWASKGVIDDAASGSLTLQQWKFLSFPKLANKMPGGCRFCSTLLAKDLLYINVWLSICGIEHAGLFQGCALSKRWRKVHFIVTLLLEFLSLQVHLKNS